MSRHAIFFLSVGFLALGESHVTAQTKKREEGSSFENALAVQRAMEQARYHLFQAEPAKAVQALEDQLPRINGNTVYLKLLRDAYRAHIKVLLLTHRKEEAKTYVDRLCIIDPGASSDPGLHVVETASLPPNDPKVNNSKPDISKQERNAPAISIQAKPGPGTAGGDPFEKTHQLDKKPTEDSTRQGAQILGQAEQAFAGHRFAEARLLFEKAYHADPKTLDASRERWAYCILSQAVEKLNGPDLESNALPQLKRQVQGAMTLAPALGETAQRLLREIDRKTQEALEPPLNLQHLGKNAQNWNVAESSHFRIFHDQSRDLVEQLARNAERTRTEMYRKWFGQEAASSPPWEPKCEVFLFPSSSAYVKATGAPTDSPGHSRIETDNGLGRVVVRRIYLRCDYPGMMEGTLPHEITHIVMAGMFGKNQIPCWADEGLAVLSEPDHRIAEHRRNLLRHHKNRQLFSVRELMHLSNYPSAKKVQAFYAQSVSLVDFLTRQHGPKAFIEFLRDGLDQGYETALRKHYNLQNFQDLEQRWTQAALVEPSQIVAGKN